MAASFQPMREEALPELRAITEHSTKTATIVNNRYDITDHMWGYIIYSADSLPVADHYSEGRFLLKYRHYAQ